MYRFKFRHESTIRNYLEYFRLDLKAMKVEKEIYDHCVKDQSAD